MTDKTAIAKQQTTATTILPVEQRFQPTTMNALWWLAETLAMSKTTPKELKSKEDIFSVLMLGAELKLSTMQSIRSIYIVNGKPALSADLMGAIVQNDDRCEYLQMIKFTADECEYETKRRGQPKSISMAFTIEDARAAKLVEKGGMYEKYPKQMLRARALAQICRAIYPDIVMGLYDPDELREPSREPQQPTQNDIPETEYLDAEFVETTEDSPDEPEPETPAGPTDFSGKKHTEKTKWFYNLVTDCGLGSNHGDNLREALKIMRGAASWKHLSPDYIEAIGKALSKLSPKSGEDGALSERALSILKTISDNKPAVEPETPAPAEIEPESGGDV